MQPSLNACTRNCLRWTRPSRLRWRWSCGWWMSLPNSSRAPNIKSRLTTSVSLSGRRCTGPTVRCAAAPCAGTPWCWARPARARPSHGVLPVVGAVMAPDNRTVGCALIIDPKREIKSHVTRLRHDGITVHDIDVEADRQRPVLNLMAGEALSSGHRPRP